MPSVIISVVIASVNGYALANWRFKGANAFFTILIFGAFIPYQFFLMLPYIMSILAMIVMARKTKYPQALLVPFRRGERV